MFMLVEVPDPVWKTSTGNSSSHSPGGHLGGGRGDGGGHRPWSTVLRRALTERRRPLDQRPAPRSATARRSAPRSGSSPRPAASGPATWRRRAPGPRPWSRARCASERSRERDSAAMSGPYRPGPVLERVARSLLRSAAIVRRPTASRGRTATRVSRLRLTCLVVVASLLVALAVQSGGAGADTVGTARAQVAALAGPAERRPICANPS